MRAGALPLVAIFAATVSVAASPVAADPGTDDFDRATAMIARGEVREAAAALIAFADESGGGPRAAEALFLAAELLEDRLDAPARAADLYRRISDEHPDSRVALAAERRLEALAALLGDGAEREGALSRYYSIRRRLPDIGAARALAEAEALLAEHPELAAAGSIRLWMAGVAERDGDLDRAARLYDQVLAGEPGADLAFDAGLRAATLAISRRHFDRAEALLGGLRGVGNSQGRREARRSAQAALERARLRARLYAVAFAVIIAVPLVLLGLLRQAAGSWRTAAREVLRPPIEAAYMIPVAAAFALFAMTGHHGMARAVIALVGAGLAITWLSGVGLRAAPRSRWRPLVHAALAALAVAAATYIVLHRDGLIDLIVSTVRFGPDV